jgi:hypothetical protein
MSQAERKSSLERLDEAKCETHNKHIGRQWAFWNSTTRILINYLARAQANAGTTS